MLDKLFICYLIADFLTGLFHWFEDAYATKTWWFNIGIDNIEHHKQPGLMGRMGSFISRNTIPFALAIIVTPILIIIGLNPAYVLLTSALTAMGNEVHSWNHRSKNNAFITFLQETAIVQTKRQHSKHHKPPYNKCYCVLGNIVNPIVDAIHLWAILEYLLSLIGLKPKRMTESRDFF